MALFKFLDRYYERLYYENKAKFEARFPYKVTVSLETVDLYEFHIHKWLFDNVGKLDKDYRIAIDRLTNTYCFKNFEICTEFALRWM